MNQSASYARKAHILTLLKSGRPVSVPSIKESLEKITLQDGTSLACVDKTIIRDISDLKAMGCPISWRRSLDSYELEDKSWDLPATPLLGRDEILAIAVGEQFGEAALPKKVGKQVCVIARKIFEANTEQFYHGADLSALKILLPPVPPETEKVFSIVYDAWATRHLLSISYADERGAQSDRTIEPQALFFYGTSWYIRAYCYLRGKPRTFTVSRIEKATIQDGTFTPRPDLYENASFDDFGIFDENKVYRDVVIRLTQAGRQSAVAHVLHSKQTIVDNGDGTFTITAPKKAKSLVVQWILAQRGEATPVAPAELVKEVLDAGKKIIENILSIEEVNK